VNRVLLALVALPLALASCKKAENQQAAPAATTAAATAAPVPTAPDTAAAIATAAATGAVPPAPGGDIATPEDFEQQALDEINPQNLEKELDTLEEQIGK
jgi:hypothetical protein